MCVQKKLLFVKYPRLPSQNGLATSASQMTRRSRLWPPCLKIKKGTYSDDNYLNLTDSINFMSDKFDIYGSQLKDFVGSTVGNETNEERKSIVK